MMVGHHLNTVADAFHFGGTIMKQFQQRTPHGQPAPLPTLVFFIPGLGQLIQGRVATAIVWWIVLVSSAISMAIFIGFVTTPILYLICVADAARYKG